jgi:NADPH-dependent 2,4-dienoyl-CoA reductase/sulfur reductase-like enzyme/ferredoxin
MDAISAARLFQNYTKIKPGAPRFVWTILRVATLAVTLSLAGLLVVSPTLGLTLFWGFAIPVVPALLVLAPGLWRQICPMALLNQIPRMGGFSRERDLPENLRNMAFTIAVVTFFAAVALRAPFLNRDGVLVGAGVVGVLVLAFFGGLIFKGRSGWCGTFCPLGPIQRNYGHAPLIMVRNGYCSTCLGCQKNCYDFNPRAAIFADMFDEDPRYAGQRRFFMAMMPGMILGYFLQAPAVPYGEPLRALILVAATCASVGLYQACVSFFGLNAFRAANLFAGAAIVAFYFFAGPIILKTIGALTGFAASPDLVKASRAVGPVLALIVLAQGRRNERVFAEASRSTQNVHVDQRGQSLADRLAKTTSAHVTERSTGASFPVAPDQTLLEAMEAARVKINFGCRSGMCGADPVGIREGHDNLSPACGDELATLRRLGLEGKARLACMAEVKGAVVIDLDPGKGKACDLPDKPAAPIVDRAIELGVQKVVIIGNGVAGLGAAEGLRRASASVEIDVVTDEPHHFYNRMAIGRVIYGRTAMDGLYLLPDSWYADNRIEVWRNTIATEIDRATQTVRLGTGETLRYDRLVLATGAKAAPPGPNYETYANAFVLRSAYDAQAIRVRVQSHQVRRAVIIGGGVLGIEAADALHHLGVKVSILQRSGRLMDRQLDETGASRLTQYLETIGIEVITGATIKSFEGAETLAGVRLADNRLIEGDLFIASVGALPNAGLAKTSGLEVGRGIKVDAFMRTSDPHVYAIGDVAELPGAMVGLWPVGAAQAATASANILGASAPYVPPHILLQLKCDGIDLRSFGDVDLRDGDEVLSAQTDKKSWWRLVIRAGSVVGVVFVGTPGSARELTKAMKGDIDVKVLFGVLRGAS